MGSCRRRRNSILIACNRARIRFLIVLRPMTKVPGMVEVFSGKQGARDDSQEAEIKDLHAKIGELTVAKDAARAYAVPPAPRSCSLSKAFSR